jgi:8-oxo-dGTP pyrophosphatase MutT (NUDIX family)
MSYFMRKWHKFINEQKDSSKVAKMVLFSGDKILLLVSNSEHFMGKLDLPGGHLHHNEDPTEGLRREIKEETGLIVTDYRELHEDGNLIFFWGHLPKGDVTLSEEHSAYYLLHIDEISEKGYKMSDILFNAVKKAYELVQKA